MRSSYLFVSALILGISLIKSQATHVRRAVGRFENQVGRLASSTEVGKVKWSKIWGAITPSASTPLPTALVRCKQWVHSYIPSILLIYLCTLISANFPKNCTKYLSILRKYSSLSNCMNNNRYKLKLLHPILCDTSFNYQVCRVWWGQAFVLGKMFPIFGQNCPKISSALVGC